LSGRLPYFPKHVHFQPTRNAVKILIGVTPSGAISFVSNAYEGFIPDHKLVEVCGLLEKLEPSDEVMAD